MRNPSAWKEVADIFALSVDFAPWPLNSGATLTASNAKGSLGAVIRDLAGNDVSAAMIDGSPSIDATGKLVVVTLKAGTTETVYQLTVTGPTTDGELLTQVVDVSVI